MEPQELSSALTDRISEIDLLLASLEEHRRQRAALDVPAPPPPPGKTRAVTDQPVQPAHKVAVLKEKMLNGQSLKKEEKLVLAEAGELLEGVDLVLARWKAGKQITEKEIKKLKKEDLYFEDVSGEMPCAEAEDLLQKAIDSVPKVKRGKSTTWLPDEGRYTEKTIWVTPTLPSEPLDLLQELDDTQKKVVRKALAIGKQQAREQRRAKEKEDVLRKLREEMLKKHQKNLENQSSQNVDETDLFSSASAITAHGSKEDALYQSLHPGEFEDYNVMKHQKSDGIGGIDALETALGDNDEELVKVKTHTMTDEERQTTTTQVVDGKLARGDGSVLDTTDATAQLSFSGDGQGKHLWVQTEGGEIRTGGQDELSQNVGEQMKSSDRQYTDTGFNRQPTNQEEFEKYGYEKNVEVAHHTTLGDGQAVTGAGEMEVVDGKVRSINNSSGHYKPGMDGLSTAVETLDEQGVLSSAATVTNTATKTTYRADEVLASGGDLSRLKAIHERMVARGETNFAKIEQQIRAEVEKLNKQKGAVRFEGNALDEAIAERKAWHEKRVLLESSGSLQSALEAEYKRIAGGGGDLRELLTEKLDALVEERVQSDASFKLNPDARQQMIDDLLRWNGSFEGQMEAEYRRLIKDGVSRRTLIQSGLEQHLASLIQDQVSRDSNFVLPSRLQEQLVEDLLRWHDKRVQGGLGEDATRSMAERKLSMQYNQKLATLEDTYKQERQGLVDQQANHAEDTPEWTKLEIQIGLAVKRFDQQVTALQQQCQRQAEKLGLSEAELDLILDLKSLTQRRREMEALAGTKAVSDALKGDSLEEVLRRRREAVEQNL